MICIQTVNFSSINGFNSENWIPQIGIRQGDPLSHYLFIMCLNFLIRKFVEGHHNKNFDGFQINKQSHPIPILCFADDCIIFCKMNDKSIHFITQTLQLFAKEAGLSRCWNKSKVFFSKNTPKIRISEICNFLGYNRVIHRKNIWVYL